MWCGIVHLLLAALLCFAPSASAGCRALEEKRFPNVWLQVADTRTASTLQFATMVIVGNLLCGSGNVDFRYLQRLWDGTVGYVNNGNPTHLSIVKTHDFNFINASQPDTLLFTSIRQENKNFQRKWLRESYPNRVFFLTQLTGRIEQGSADFINATYRVKFNLTDDQVEVLQEVVGSWEKLRICCGSQMSASWREYLHLNDMNLPSHHVCKSFGNMTLIERYYIAASRRYSFPLIDVTHEGQCYCTWELTARLKMGFNDGRYGACS